MPTTFIWKGRTEEGVIITGETEAENEGELLLALRKKRYNSKIRKTERRKKRFLSLGKVSNKDILFFTRQFATLFASGVPVVQAFDALIGQIKNKTFKKKFSFK